MTNLCLTMLCCEYDHLYCSILHLPLPSPQGIIGNDSRHYALDLFRIFPPDANFLLRPEGARIRHKMAVLRPEMIDTFLR